MNTFKNLKEISAHKSNSGGCDLCAYRLDNQLRYFSIAIPVL